MRMAELSDRSGLPVATIKFYLREGLLAPGESTAATRAVYDESHVRRLRLVRALIDVAGLRLDAVRQVLAAVDDEGLSWHEAVGSAHTRLAPSPGTSSPRALARVEALLARRGWTTGRDSPHTEVLAQALDALDGLEHPVSDRLLDVYADAATLVAEQEVAGVSDDDHVAATEQVVVGTLLLEPVLLAIRRIAQENVSLRTRGQR
jgi:DNA-binding transcriptional MerR regulator